MFSVQKWKNMTTKYRIIFKRPGKSFIWLTSSTSFNYLDSSVWLPQDFKQYIKKKKSYM